MANQLEISLTDAAHRLGLNYLAAWNLALRGDLEARRVGSRWRVSIEALEQFARERESVEATAG